MPFHPRPHNICPEQSPPLCTHSCTEWEGQRCLHVVTGKVLKQEPRKTKTGLMLRYSSPETPVEITQ